MRFIKMYMAEGAGGGEIKFDYDVVDGELAKIATILENIETGLSSNITIKSYSGEADALMADWANSTKNSMKAAVEKIVSDTNKNITTVRQSYAEAEAAIKKGFTTGGGSTSQGGGAGRSGNVNMVK